MSVYLDLSKVFDTLEHGTLFKKLEIYGIRGTALKWFQSYLTDRTMHAKCNINGTVQSSSDKKITFGTPQGSCLGPLLFLIFAMICTCILRKQVAYYSLMTQLFTIVTKILNI